MKRLLKWLWRDPMDRPREKGDPPCNYNPASFWRGYFKDKGQKDEGTSNATSGRED